MAQQFTLKLVNPALAQTQTPNEIFTGLEGGNKLDLILTNLSGFDTSFVPDDGDLLLKFPASILDDAAAQKITVAAPWTLDGVDTPATDPDKRDNKAAYVLKLKPPADPGVAFAANASVTVSLADIEPTAKGNATVVAACTFTDLGLSMIVNNQLAVLGAAKPDNKPLVGDGNALRLTVKVNDGPATNAIVVTSRPVTAQNAAENRIQLNFDFQDQNLPGGTQSDAELGRLVPKWDPLNPPTFRVQFPYYGSTGDFAAPQDLTDDRRQQDGTNYNTYTSAWNIKLSLSRTDPDNTQNDWWTIQLDPLSLVPSWLIRPTQQNKYLFTGTNQGPNAPGPFLDLFFSHIYTDLPIDASKPETILYLETYDFPGFNDRLQQQPIFKEPSVQICSFDGSVTTQGGVTTLTLNWKAENADHCLISGDATKQDPVSTGAYSRTIDMTNKLKSSYTLTAVGSDGVSALKRTIHVRWKEGTQSSTSSFQNPTAIDLSPDGKSIYLVGDYALNVLDCQTLLVQGNPLSLPDGAMVMNVAATPDGSRLFLAATPFSGGGSIVAYTSTLKPITTIPAVDPGTNDSPNLYPMAISDDGSQLAISMPYPEEVQQSIIGYSTDDLTSLPSGGSPAPIPGLRQVGLAIDGGNLYYPDKDGLGVLDRTTFKPRPGSPVSLKSSDQVPYTPGPLAVSPDGTRVATLALGIINNQPAFILCLVDVTAMKLLKRVQVGTGYSDAPPVATTGMTYSLDGEYLIVFGTNYATDPPQPESTVLSVYDADSLQELEWSPIPVTKFYGNFVMAPDGSRFYVSTYDTGTGTTGKVIELVPYFPAAVLSQNSAEPS